MQTVQTKDNEIIFTRELDAPRELVWRAWTDPDWYKRWWGPEHFTCPVATLDVRPGGRWHSAMQDPDGNRYWSTGAYREVVPFERLVMTDSFSDEEGNIISAAQYGMGDDIPLEMLTTVLLEDIGGNRTRMTTISYAMPEGPIREGAIAGWTTSLDKLENVLEQAKLRHDT